MKNRKSALAFIGFLTLFMCGAYAQQAATPETVVELAKKLANPIASLISVPFQNNTYMD